IITVMIIFWLLSVFASVYLANWSRKPILESYEKQKNFVEDASHELRTPLTVLQNRLESLFRKPDETILDNYETVASSLEEVRNMRILTTNLLNLARRDDKLNPEIEEIEPNFFDNIFENYSLIAEESGKVLSCSNQLRTSIKSDKTLIKQVMTILFDNAVKYTGDDGAIRITVSNSDRKLVITVADNGSGISEEDKSKIFDRFYRIDKARTRQTGGFGLGLSLAKQIVEALKGTIAVRDNTPTGTVFEIKLNT
ncbi:sensor histidine kinase, partial [Streptococcus sobrinus]